MRGIFVRRSSRVLGALALFGTLALALGACGSDNNSSSDTSSGDIQAQKVIRFAFAPDPVWNYIVDSGILEKESEKSGIEIDAFQSFDEFGLFAGGNADVLSTGTYETWQLDDQGIDTTTFGKYNANKDIFIVAGDSDAKTAADLPKGCKVAAESTTGNTIIWAGLVKQIDDREIAEGSDDLPLVTADYQVMPQLVADGDVCAGILDPFQGTPALRDGSVKPLYDGKAASQLFAEQVAKDPKHVGVDSNNFVARKDWFDENPDLVSFFLNVWQQGMDEWTKNPDQIIHDNPADFAINSPEDEAFIKDYIHNTFDFQQKSVYLTPEWVQNEFGVFDLLLAAGAITPDTPLGEFAIIDPKTGEVTQTIQGEATPSGAAPSSG
jgi:ABC-type nitrate/sulfonate/bicarbonate transport system substrate-binding protein